jgi:DNA-directed RNA polymerase specialized sigma subunit
VDNLDIKSQLKRILAIVTCYTPPYIDRENITIDILLESWSHRIEQPSLEFIKNRCFNSIREQKLNQKSVLKKVKEAFQRQTQQQEIQDHDEVNMLTQCLNNLEKKVIIYRFYQDMSIKEISDTLKLPVLQISELLQGALYKMREAAT